MRRFSLAPILLSAALLVPTVAAPLPDGRAAAQSDSLTEAERIYQEALRLNRQRSYAQSEPLLRRALSIREAVLGPDHEEVGQTLHTLAEANRRLHRYQDAEALFLRAVAVREKALGPEHAKLADSVNNLALVHRAQGRFAEAEQGTKRALAIYETSLGPQSPMVAIAAGNLGQLYQAQRRYGDAEPLLRRALAIRESSLGGEHVDVAMTLHDLALVWWNLGRLAEAEPLFVRALAIREKKLGSEHLDVASTASDLGELLRVRNAQRESEAQLKRALAIRTKALGPEHALVGYSLGNLGELYRLQGRYIEAESHHKQAVAIREKALGPEHSGVATSLNGLGYLYLHLGRWTESEALNKRALAIREKALGTDHQAVGQSLSNLAIALRNQGRYAEAEPLFKRALEIRERMLGDDRVETGYTLAFLGSLYREQGRYAEAEPLLQRALAIHENALGPAHPEVGVDANELGALYRAQGRYAEAEASFRRAIDVTDRAHGPEHPLASAPLQNLALVQAAQRRYAEAEQTSQRALRIAERAHGPEHPSVARSLDGIAAVAEQQGRFDEALSAARRSVEIRELRASSASAVDLAGVESERRNVRNSFLRFLSIAAARTERSPRPTDVLVADSFRIAQLAVHSSADQALSQAAARFASSDDTLARAVRDRQDVIARRLVLDKMLTAAAAQSIATRDAVRENAVRVELATLDLKLAVADENLRRAFPEYADLSQPRPLPLGDAQSLLAPDEAICAFVVAGDATYRFIVRKDGATFRKLPVGRRSLDAQVKALRRTLDPSGIARLTDLPVFDAAGAHQLYRTLFEDSQPILAGIRRLLIVPDGPLGGLSFSVLLTRPASEGAAADRHRGAAWLTRDHAITLLPSIGSLRALRVFAARVPQPGEPFLGFGDPDLKGVPGQSRGGTVERLAARGLVADVSLVRQLDPLPESRQELQRIARSLKADPKSIFVRGQATEKRLKSLDLSRYRVIAFATHGLMAGQFDGYGEPALVLTPPPVGNDLDDGLLAASEVAQLRLNADWVILSACNTAAPDGTPGAEGLSGLARAFFYAGSRALLVSHWPVVSDASVRLTTGAIEALASEPGIGRAEALQRAMLALLDDPKLPAEYSHPAVWAPFSLVGEGGPGR